LIFADQITFALLDSVPNLLAILNRQLQIVFANQPLYELIGVDDLSHINRSSTKGEFFPVSTPKSPARLWRK